MKKCVLVVLSLLALLFLAGMVTPDTVIVTAMQVDGANDIEYFIELATNNGTRPGTVILDASEGPFVYTDEDRSINIYYSNVTLRSENGALIANCADGVFFDNFSTERVTIEGIAFVCNQVGVSIPWGQHSKVSIKNNIIVGFIGVLLNQIQGNQVVGNYISAEWQGVLLTYGTHENNVIGNTITLVQNAGIALEGNNTGNKVHGNKVVCSVGVECLTVNVPPEDFENNKISGNTP